MNMSLNKYLRAGHIEKLKNFKFWADQNVPETFKPVLNYTLGWLAPDLLGTGFSVVQQTDSEVVAMIPLNAANKDFQNQIHAGLVINAGLEMIKSLLYKHMVGVGFQMARTEMNLTKKMNWLSDLKLKLFIDLEVFEMQLIQFQNNKKADFDFEVSIYCGESKKFDQINYKIEIQKVNLLS